MLTRALRRFDSFQKNNPANVKFTLKCSMKCMVGETRGFTSVRYRLF